MGSSPKSLPSGYRAFSRRVLENLPFQVNSDNFVFDNEMLAQIIYFRYRIGEVSCPTRYFEEASSVNLKNSIVYGLGVLNTCLKYTAQKLTVADFIIFTPKRGIIHKGYYQKIE